jgi:hypothetical protein
MSAVEFFTYACDALMVNPPHASDFSILALIASLGIVPGQPFNARALDTTDVKAGATAAKEAIAAAVPRLGTQANGWTIVRETIGVYGNAYLQRAAVTLAGLGANPPEDAIYPLLVTDAGGDATTGDKDYVIHFDADKLLPVDAFWSITMYDAEGYQVPKRAHKAEMRAKHQA